MIKQLHCYGTALFLCLLIYLTRVTVTEIFEDETAQVDEWLEQNNLGEYKKLFRDLGISTLSGCGSPEQLENLPELPLAEEKRIRRAAQVLQQRLVLRQWLATHRLQHVYNKLLSLDVSSIEDVYWLEDTAAAHVMEPRDLPVWSAARHGLPTRRDDLQLLKADLWTTVVKTSKHQDAWTWGGMLVVSVSVCGLVTLAAVTQPSLAPEAKHSLLQYVTGKYLHPASCKVEWGWQEPQEVGDTMVFTVLCYQRNGQPYPVCDTDHLAVDITHGNNKIASVVELGSDEPAEANTARVKFTVRGAGAYVISVTIESSAVCGSPYRKWFRAGRVEARRSRVWRGGVGGAALVLAAGAPRTVHVHPRDRFDNPAPLSSPDDVEAFKVRLCTLGGREADAAATARAEYDAVNQRVPVTLTFGAAGVYRAAFFHDGAPLLNGHFDCIVLTASEASGLAVGAGAGEGGGAASYEARLVGGARPRRVLCCLSSKNLIVKDYILKFIPKRITSFRLCPSTKLILKADPAEGEGRFTIEDGVQPPLELASPQRDLIAATFSQLLLHNCGGEDTFKSKQEYFYLAVRRVHARRPHERVPLRVLRADLLRSTMRATRHFSTADWCKNFDVSFHGEQGVDWGGVRREWCSLVCGALFGPALGLFAPLHDSPAALVHPNPDRPNHLKLKYFEFAGKIMGKCLYESALGGSYRQLVRARFTRSFLAQIIGLRVHYKHFEHDDPALYLSKVKYVLEADLDACEAAELTFSDEVYDARGRLALTRDLVPGGAALRVTNDQRTRYLDALAQWRLATRCRREVAAFLRGLAPLVPDRLLAVFDENELELLACGSGELSVADWRAHSLVSGRGHHWERQLQWLWTALGALSPEERARVLQFATGCGQLPAGGFADLTPRFHIAPAAAARGALPTAHTCFNQLCLPRYDSYEQQLRALLLAVHEGAEGFALM